MSTFSVVILTATPPNHRSENNTALVRIDGREALLRSVELFLNRGNVKHIQLVIPPNLMDEAKQKFGAHLGFSGVKLVAGGPRWMDQICSAAPAVPAECTHVIIHDAARPAVPFSDIDSAMNAAEINAAVALVTAVRSPLIETDEGGNPMGYRASQNFMQLLTPQVFSRAKFMELVKAKMEIHASELTLLEGSHLNQRVNGPADAALVKAMIAMLPKRKVSAMNNPFEEAQW